MCELHHCLALEPKRTVIAMDVTKIAAAWEEWLESEEGKRASDVGTLKPGDSHYLNNRLERAFQAGMRFGATAVADEVIAAMQREKQPS